MSTWWVDHADPQLAQLCNPDIGPFGHCHTTHGRDIAPLETALQTRTGQLAARPRTNVRSRPRSAVATEHMREHAMAEEENIAQELHGHLTQMLRTSLSGGLQMSEQRARRRQHEAEKPNGALATEAARQLEERKRAEREASALLAQQRITRQETGARSRRPQGRRCRCSGR